MPANIAPLRAYRRAFTNPQNHTARRSHLFNTRTRAGLHYCLRVARAIARAVARKVKAGMELEDSVDGGESGIVVVGGMESPS
ncbi:MAG: hypothetical protein ACT6FD_04515 [Methanosarcinaceae archaeon]